MRDDRCPAHDVLAGFVERVLEETERGSVESHMERCARCRTTVSHLVTTFAELPSDPPTRPIALPQPGSKLGRYHVLDWVAAGSMGAVFSAYDPQLHRRVALKVLPPRDEAEAEVQRDRFLGEAQAMATVSHPNVIAVHDVGVHDGIAFFAMEFVEGVTLRRWLAEERTVEQIVDVLAAAAEGLAAAHRAGLVHRDFKPDNVVVGDDRVRVIDFGLVRFAAARTAQDGNDDASPVVTRAGSLVGTPAYMAPEQLRGQAADARSDQFSFCVAFYEALCGRRPWQRDTVAELLSVVGQEPIRWDRSRPGVTRSLRRAIERGLAHEPGERFASMTELVGHLRRRSWSRRVVSVALAVGVTGAAVGLYGMAATGSEPHCVPGSERMAEIWDASLEGEVEQELGAGELDEAARWLVRELDAYAAAWASQYDGVCRAVLAREATPGFVDPRIVCLERARDRFEQTVRVIRDAGPTAAANAPGIVDGLDVIERCAEASAPPAFPAPSYAQGSAVETVRKQLAHVDALRTMGRFDDAAALASEADRRATEIGYAPLQLEAELAVGRLERPSLARTLQRALAEGHHHVAAEAATLLSCEEAEAGRFGSARAYADTALGLVERPDVSTRVESIRVCMGLIAMWEGDYETAAAEFHSALVVTEARLGTDHPQTARLEGKLAEALSWREHDAESERLFRKAASVLMRELGARHPWVVALRLQRAQVLVQTGELDDAEAELGEVMALGSDAAAHGLLGHIFAERRRLPEAEAQYRAAASRFAASRGPQHPNTLGARASVAQMLFAQERYGEAVQVYDEVFPDLEQALGPDHPEVVKLKVYFLLSEQARGRFAQTQAPLEHVVVRCSEPKQIDPLSCMTAASLLARAVLETAGDVNRARHLAEFADASVAGVPHVPPDHRKYLDAVWEAVKRAEATTSRRAPTKAASPR